MGLDSLFWDPWVWIDGSGFLGLESRVWIQEFAILGLDSWVWIPWLGLMSLDSFFLDPWVWIYGFGFLGLTLGPITVFLGFMIQFVAILYKSKKATN